MISGEVREDGARVGFTLEDIASSIPGILAHVNIRQGPRIGKYGVNLTDISRVGVSAIVNALSNADVVVIDEIGPMELCSTVFVDSVTSALRSTKPLIGTIHHNTSHPIVRSIKTSRFCEILEVTTTNRDQLPYLIQGKLEGAH